MLASQHATSRRKSTLDGPDGRTRRQVTANLLEAGILPPKMGIIVVILLVISLGEKRWKKRGKNSKLKGGKGKEKEKKRKRKRERKNAWKRKKELIN